MRVPPAFRVLGLLGLFTALAACGAPAQLEAAPTTVGAPSTEEQAKRDGRESKGGFSVGEAPPPVAGKPYDLVVTFESRGEGTDVAARGRLEEVLVAAQNASRAHGRWGDQGEFDECVDAERLTPSERTDLVQRARAAVKDGHHVTVAEHAPCRHDFTVAEQSFELVVVFFSKGQGVDHRAERDLDKIEDGWRKPGAIRHASHAWGREGEHNECYDFGSNQAARDDFLHGIRMSVAGSDRVRVYQNARCGSK